MRRTRRLTLRARLVILGGLGVGVALGAGAALLYSVLSYTGLRTLDHDAAATSDQVVSLAQADRLPDPIPVTGTSLVQLVDARNRVVGASMNADRLTALLTPAELRAAADHPVEVAGSRVGLDGELRVTATPIEEGDRTVVVAESLVDLRRSLHLLRTAVAVVFPLLLIAMVLVGWRLVGAALRPVEELRAGAVRISGSGRTERLPVPDSVDEIRALALTLNSMLDRLEAAHGRERDFAADVAHELRSPLASMRTQLEVAQHLGEGGDLVDGLHADVLRMATLVEDLLTLARLEASPAAAPAQPVAVADLLAHLRERYADGRVALVAQPPPRAAVVAGDPDALDRVLANLVENALRHARSRVEVAVLSAGPRSVRLVVDDDGPGIPERDRERVWLRFTRLDEARARDAGGSGLGLAIVRELLAQHGGRATLEDAPLGGLRVAVDLPLFGATKPGPTP